MSVSVVEDVKRLAKLKVRTGRGTFPGAQYGKSERQTKRPGMVRLGRSRTPFRDALRSLSGPLRPGVACLRLPLAADSLRPLLLQGLLPIKRAPDLHLTATRCLTRSNERS